MTSAGREVGKYDAGVTAEATDATLVQSLEHGFDHLNGKLAVMANSAGAFDGEIAPLFNACDDEVVAQQDALRLKLRGSGVILGTSYIQGLQKSIRDQYVARAARTWVKTLISEAEANLENSISRSTEAAALGKAASEAAAKVVEATAKHLESIRLWESGKATPTGDSPKELSDAVTDGIKELVALSKNLQVQAAHHKAQLVGQTYKLSMLNKVAESSEAVVAKFDAIREENVQKAIITGYNSYQRLADQSEATHE